MKSDKPCRRPEDFEPADTSKMLTETDTSGGPPPSTQNPPPPTPYDPPEIAIDIAAAGH